MKLERYIDVFKKNRDSLIREIPINVPDISKIKKIYDDEFGESDDYEMVSVYKITSSNYHHFYGLYFCESGEELIFDFDSYVYFFSCFGAKE
ncbi:DUF7683 domain-containing protein [Methylobrevis albus]